MNKRCEKQATRYFIQFYPSAASSRSPIDPTIFELFEEGDLTCASKIKSVQRTVF